MNYPSSKANGIATTLFQKVADYVGDSYYLSKIVESIENRNILFAGVIGIVTGIIGSIQALEVLKYIVRTEERLTGRMYVLGRLTMN